MRIEVVDQGIVQKHILIIDHLIGATLGAMRQVGTHTQRVIVRQLPVHASRIRQVIILPRHRVRTILPKHLIPCGDVLDRAVLAIVLMEIVHRAKHVDTVLAIVGPQLHLRTVEIVAKVVLVGQRQVEAEAVALLADGTDAHHSPNRRVILRTRVVDHLHVADILAAQPLQLAVVAHQSPINIY